MVNGRVETKNTTVTNYTDIRAFQFEVDKVYELILYLTVQRSMDSRGTIAI